MTENFINKCSICSEEMRKGYIQSSTRLAWVPEVSKLSVEPSRNKESVVLSKQNRFSINYVDAYLCESCKKVVIDYSDNEG